MQKYHAPLLLLLRQMHLSFFFWAFDLWRIFPDRLLIWCIPQTIWSLGWPYMIPEYFGYIQINNFHWLKMVYKATRLSSLKGDLLIPIAVCAVCPAPQSKSGLQCLMPPIKATESLQALVSSQAAFLRFGKEADAKVVFWAFDPHCSLCCLPNQSWPIRDHLHLFMQYHTPHNQIAESQIWHGVICQENISPKQLLCVSPIRKLVYNTYKADISGGLRPTPRCSKAVQRWYS